MGNDVIKEQAGSVRTHTGAQGIDYGTTYDLMKPLLGEKQVTLLAGTTGSNYMAGTSGADMFVPNGASGARPDKLAPRDVIDGQGGNDVVLLGGKQSDWKARLPGVIDYPAGIDRGFWDQSPQSAYGRSVVLENIHTKSLVVMRDVETVAFANGQLSFEAGAQPGVLQPPLSPEHAAELQAAISSKKIESVPTKIYGALAEVGATPADIERAKVEGSFAAQKKLDRIPFSDQMGGNMYEVGHKIADDIMQKARGTNEPAASPLSAPSASAPKV